MVLFVCRCYARPRWILQWLLRVRSLRPLRWSALVVARTVAPRLRLHEWSSGQRPLIALLVLGLTILTAIIQILSRLLWWRRRWRHWMCILLMLRSYREASTIRSTSCAIWSRWRLSTRCTVSCSRRKHSSPLRKRHLSLSWCTFGGVTGYTIPALVVLMVWVTHRSCMRSPSVQNLPCVLCGNVAY